MIPPREREWSRAGLIAFAVVVACVGLAAISVASVAMVVTIDAATRGELWAPLLATGVVLCLYAAVAMWMPE